MKTSKVGRSLLFVVNFSTAFNGLIADWNRTHLFNANWPPHAKFHDGMTISLGLLLGGVGMAALLWKRKNQLENIRLATLPPVIFFLSMITAALYPGAGGIETEFPDYWPKLGGFSFSEVPFAFTFLIVTLLGWKLAESGVRTGASSPPAPAVAASRAH